MPDFSSYVTVGEAARRLNRPPQVISDIIYRRILNEEATPLVGGRRLIHVDSLPELAAILDSRSQRAKGAARAR